MWFFAGLPLAMLVLSKGRGKYIDYFYRNVLKKGRQGEWFDAYVDLPPDETCYSWVVNNIQYASDASVYRSEEYFSKASETLRNRRGDCDDMAILLANCMILKGYENVKVVMGVIKSGGHAWVEWNDYCIDPALRKIMKKEDYYRELKVQIILWFTPNEYWYKFADEKTNKK